jgi:acetolactate decarboxylase
MMLSPFAVVTHFKSDMTVELQPCPDLSSLFAQFDQLRHTDNFFFALRVDGEFDYAITSAI